ncbi:hypothetical protein QLQ80_02570 [Mycoplasma sp. M5725]|uniref:Lipoprotein n=1 Tax=Mycoplasma phocimorsus TaxID=3045839 RepID=A0AAJ1PSJ8_9MOLU|nr:InlB B-repeat-containing protein [Mycoplasma phocimorsus]MDJ1645953.1 hypothetical protein [Mycoplasma phocimorsus]
MKKRIVLNALLFSSLAMTVSCGANKQDIITHELNNSSVFSETESYIFSNITLNIQDITVYDAIGEITNSSLEITNLNKFRSYGIYLSLGKVSVDYEKEEVQIEVFYKTKEKKGEKAIILRRSFLDFKPISSNNWKAIFEGLAQFSIIEILGKDKDSGKWIINVKNEYATASNIIISPYSDEKTPPPADKISYRLTVTNSRKVTGQKHDATSKYQLSGGKTVTKEQPKVIFYGYGKGQFWTKTIENGSIGKNDVDPTKQGHKLDNWKDRPGYKFVGWSSKKDATEPDLFLDGKKQEFNEPTSVYAVFAKGPASLFLNSNNNKQTLKLDENGILTREHLIDFIEKNVPEPQHKDKWSYNEEDLFLVNAKGERTIIQYDEQGNVNFKFELGNEYEIKVKWNHKPFISFIDEETNKELIKLYLEEKEDLSGEKSFWTPKFSLDLEKFKKQGKYLEAFWYEQEEENEEAKLFIEREKIEITDEVNWEKRVLVRFKKTKEVNVEKTKLEDKLHSQISKIYLTLDNKIREQDLPKVDFSWFKGKSERLSSEAASPNNPDFDKRTKEEKDKGVEFDGWYYDAQFSRKIYFKDGVSTKPLIGGKIYPKFKINIWDKLRDIRNILDTILTISESSTKVAMAVVKNQDNNKNVNAVEYILRALSLLKWVAKLALGGKVTWAEFWSGYDEINNLLAMIMNDQFKTEDNEVKDGKVYKENIHLRWMALGLLKEILQTATGLFLKNQKEEKFGKVFKTENIRNIWDLKQLFNEGGNDSSKNERIENIRFLTLAAFFYFNYGKKIKKGSFKNTLWKKDVDENNDIEIKKLLEGSTNSSHVKVDSWKTKDIWTIIWEANGGNNSRPSYKHPWALGSWDIATSLGNSDGLLGIVKEIVSLVYNHDKFTPFDLSKKAIDISANLSKALTKLINGAYTLKNTVTN